MHDINFYTSPSQSYAHDISLHKTKPIRKNAKYSRNRKNEKMPHNSYGWGKRNQWSVEPASQPATIRMAVKWVRFFVEINLCPVLVCYNLHDSNETMNRGIGIRSPHSRLTVIMCMECMWQWIDAAPSSILFIYYYCIAFESNNNR